MEDNPEQILFPCFDGFAQRRFAARAEIMVVCVSSNKQRQRDVGQMGIQFFMPSGGAFRTWRVIAGVGFARIAKSHRDDGDFARVVELLSCQAEPVPQPVAGGIVPRNARVMHLPTGGLANDAQTRRRVHLQDRAWTAWQGMGAMGARTDIPKQLRKSVWHSLLQQCRLLGRIGNPRAFHMGERRELMVTVGGG